MTNAGRGSDTLLVIWFGVLSDSKPHPTPALAPGFVPSLGGRRVLFSVLPQCGILGSWFCGGPPAMPPPESSCLALQILPQEEDYGFEIEEKNKAVVVKSVQRGSLAEVRLEPHLVPWGDRGPIAGLWPTLGN